MTWTRFVVATLLTSLLIGTGTPTSWAADTSPSDETARRRRYRRRGQ